MSGFACGSALPGGIRMSLDRIFPPADVSVFFFVLPRVRDRSRSLNAHLPSNVAIRPQLLLRSLELSKGHYTLFSTAGNLTSLNNSYWSGLTPVPFAASRIES